MPLCFPHSSEQKIVAEAFLERGVGLSLIDTALAVRPESNLYHEVPLFSCADLARKMGILLSVPTYAEHLMTMKCAAAAAGGRQKAVQTI